MCFLIWAPLLKGTIDISEPFRYRATAASWNPSPSCFPLTWQKESKQIPYWESCCLLQLGCWIFATIVGTWTYSCLTLAYEEHAIILRSWRGHVNSPHRLRTTNVFSLTRRQTLEAIMDSLSPSCRRFVEFWTRRFCSCVMCAISRGRW